MTAAVLPVDQQMDEARGCADAGLLVQCPQQMADAQGSAGSGSWWLRHPEQMTAA